MPVQLPLVLVVHSGASAYVPVLAPELQAAGQLLIDAVIPPRTGSFRPSADFRSELDRLVEADQHLPPWPRWWSEAVFARLVPDPDLREAIGGECPRLSISFYDTVLDVTTDWAQTWTGYLRLSVGYEPEAAAAGRLGWQVRRRTGGHLDTATRPEEVLFDLLALVQPRLDAWPETAQ